MSDDATTNPIETVLTQVKSRRAFLRQAAVAAAVPAVGSLVAACSPDKGKSAAVQAPASGAAGAAGATSVPTGGTMGPNDTASLAGARANADAMDAMHEKGIKAFPAPTKGKGNQVMQPKMDGSVKVYELTAKKIQWQVSQDMTVEAWAYNEQVPGPQIRVREGDRVRIVLKNELPESTAIHFHGLEVPNDQDGVPFLTQKPVKPGDSYTYEFTVPNAGSHMYHSHHNSAKQVGLGLLGAFIVEPKQKTQYDNVDVDYVIILNDGSHGYTLNGKGFPATEPIKVKLGQTLRIRYMNEGMMIHPMHLHGTHQLVTHKDGWPLPAPYRCDTINIAPGERYDAIVKANNPGVWAFHCHILPHAESEHGMFGMVTALIVEK